MTAPLYYSDYSTWDLFGSTDYSTGDMFDTSTEQTLYSDLTSSIESVSASYKTDGDSTSKLFSTTIMESTTPSAVYSSDSTFVDWMSTDSWSSEDLDNTTPDYKEANCRDAM